MKKLHVLLFTWGEYGMSAYLCYNRDHVKTVWDNVMIVEYGWLTREVLRKQNQYLI